MHAFGCHGLVHQATVGIHRGIMDSEPNHGLAYQAVAPSCGWKIEIDVATIDRGVTTIDIGITSLSRGVTNLDIGETARSHGVTRIDIGVTTIEIGDANLSRGVTNLDSGDVFCDSCRTCIACDQGTVLAGGAGSRFFPDYRYQDGFSVVIGAMIEDSRLATHRACAELVEVTRFRW